MWCGSKWSAPAHAAPISTLQKAMRIFFVEFNRDSGLSALDQFLGFSEALERLLGRPVDLVEASAVRNPYLRATIDRLKELIYAA